MVRGAQRRVNSVAREPRQRSGGACHWVWLVLLVTVAACAGTQEKPDRPPEELYAQAMKHVEGTKLWFLPALPDYERALDLFKQVVDDYPYSEYAALSRLMIGEVQFKDHKYLEAVVGYEDFIRMHPSHPKVSYAAHQIGRCYEEEMLSKDRDQTSTLNAIDQYRKVVDQYPNTEYAAEASKKLEGLRQRAADHELYVAEFYMRRGEYRAALFRLHGLKAEYSDRIPAERIEAMIEKAKKGLTALEAEGEAREGTLPP